ncbi:hypothetical protein Trydic_g14869 [Trypoxylus dichotomus]
MQQKSVPTPIFVTEQNKAEPLRRTPHEARPLFTAVTAAAATFRCFHPLVSLGGGSEDSLRHRVSASSAAPSSSRGLVYTNQHHHVSVHPSRRQKTATGITRNDGGVIEKGGSFVSPALCRILCLGMDILLLSNSSKMF